jgi:hypothetical protein
MFSGHEERLGEHTRHLNFWRPFSILLGELSWALATKAQPTALLLRDVDPQISIGTVQWISYEGDQMVGNLNII